MARAISYFIFSSNGSYLRWDDDTTIDFRIRQYEMSITGGGGVDRLYVGAGTKVDAGALFASANTDELYLSGNFSDYSQTISAGGVYTFTGLAGGSHANEVVSFSMNSNGDKLVFANGHITVKSSDYLSVSGSYSSILAGSLTLVDQTDPALGAQPGNKPAKVFVFDAGGINIPQLPIVDEAIAVSGGGGVDKFYVRKGTNTDAIGLFASAGQDVLYLTGRFDDYTQTKSAGGVYTFTRKFTDAADASLTEVVSFSMNSSGDQLVFADGGVTLRLADYLSGGSYADITVGQLNRAITTPGLLAPTADLILASDTGSSASDRITNNATINVTGLVTGGTWQYQIDSSAWATGTASSFTATSGAHTYFVRQFDIAGNSSVVSAAVTYTLDNTAPVAPTLRLASDTGSSASDGLTNNATILVNGLETIAGTSWQYQVDGTAGSWMIGTGASFTANSGAHTYFVRQFDIAGNSSVVSTAVTYTLDNTAPVAPTLRLAVDSGSSASDNLTNNPTILVNGLETIAGTSWQYQVDGTAGSWMTGTASSFTSNSGAHSYFVRQTDAAGNTSTQSIAVSYTLDNTAPATPTLALASDTGSSASDGLTNNATILVNDLETTTGTSWQYQVDGTAGSWMTGTASSFTATSGAHSYFVRQTDVAGNASTTSSAVTYTLDNTAPATPTLRLAVDSGSSASDSLTNNPTILVNGLETITGTSWQYQVDGTAGSWMTGTASSFTATSGAHTYFVRQFDIAGNSSVVSTAVTYTLDNTAPVAPTLRLASDTGSSASDNLTNNPTILVNGLETITGTSWQYQVDGTAGSWMTGTASSFTATSGAHTYFVRQFDIAGNSSVVSTAVTYTLDNTPPSTPTLQLVSDTGTSASDGLTNNPMINVTGLNSGSIWQYSRDGGSTWTSAIASASTASFTASEGIHSYVVQQFDVAGNNATSSATYTLDTSPPSGLMVLATSGNVAENTLGAVTLIANANDMPASTSVTWSLGTGLDSALFNITSAGVLSFKTAPNYEMPRGSAFNAASNNDAYTVNVIATDAAGNASAPSAIVVNVSDVNEAPVAVGIISSRAATKNVAFSYDVSRFFSDPDTQASNTAWHTLTYTATGLPSGLTIDDSTGVISGTATAVQVASAITVTASDGGGGSGVTQTFDLEVFNGPVLSDFNVTDSVGNANFGKSGDILTLVVTMSEAVTVTPASDPGMPFSLSMTFSVNGQSTSADYTSGSGSNMLTFTGGSVPVNNGSVIRITSIALQRGTVTGNVSMQNWITTHTGQIYAGYTVDNTPPAAPTLMLASDTGISASDGLTNNATILVSGLETTVGTSWQYQVDGTADGSWVTGTGASFTANSGPHSYFVCQIDAAGNLGVNRMAIYTLDNSAPLVPALTLASDTGINHSDNLTVNPTVNVSNLESNASWQYQVDSGSWLTGSGSSFIALLGSHDYRVQQKDVAGNSSAVSVVTNYIVFGLSLASDTGISHSDSLTNNATINVSGLGIGATWQYQVDGTAGGSWVTGTGSSFTASEGVHNYTVRQTNLANNNDDETTAVTYTLDTTAIAPSLRLVSDTGTNHSDNITANATINVLGVETHASWSYQVEGVSGDWITGIGSSFTAQSGVHSYFVRQIDAAGNTSAASAVVTYTLDATAMVAADTTLGNIAAGTGGFVLIGETDGDFSGRYVSAAGDINGDGYADFIVGAYGANNRAGKSYVVFGKSNWSGLSSLNLSAIASGTGGFVLIGESNGDFSGWSVATAGDINGDGYADFMVGAYGADINGLADSGKTYVVFGRQNWSGVSALNLSTIAAGHGGFALIGQADYVHSDFSGFSVSAAGDINGDGYADFMLGEPDANRNVNGAGATYVLFGGTNWNNVTALNLSAIEAGMGGFILMGEGVYDYSGYAIGAIGDVNGDGYADFMVAATETNDSHILPGKSYVVFGKPDWSGVSALGLSIISAGTGGFVLLGEEGSNDKSGFSVAGAGDINGDGYADFIVGTYSASSPAGKSYVVFGRSNWSGVSSLNLSTIAAGTGGFVLTGEAAGDRNGFSVSSAGDFNGDGYADFIVTSRWANDFAGKTYVVFGKANWSGVTSLNLSTIATGNGGFMLAGEAVNDQSGSSVATAGDINGDGYSDLLIGASAFRKNGAGKTYVLLGGPVYFNTASVLVQGTGTVMGTSAGEAIVGSISNDILIGNGGTDRFFGGAGNDIIVLTRSDVANLTKTTATNGLLATVDGGTGIDTLRLNGANLNLSVVANIAAGVPIINSRISNIERIDLATDTTSNILTLGLSDVLDMAAMNSFNTSNGWNNAIGTAFGASVQKHQLLIDGSSNDVVRILLSAGWTRSQTVNGSSDTIIHTGSDGLQHTYYLYNSASGNAQLVIDTHIVTTAIFDFIELATPTLMLASDTGVSHNDNITSNATIKVLGLVMGTSWQYQIDGMAGNWITGTGSSFIASSGAHSYFVRQFDSTGNISQVSADVTFTLDATAIAATDTTLSNIAAGTGGFVLIGDTEDSLSGRAVATAGDINHDGYVDFIVGAYYADYQAGKSYVVFGKADLGGVSVLNLSTIAAGTGGFVLTGTTRSQSGWSVATAGDINGDGYADFMVGAYFDEGKSYIVFGRSSWVGVSTLSLSTVAAGTGGFVLSGESPGDNSGYSVASAGDINGDGYADFMMGAYRASQSGVNQLGKSYVVFGKADWSGVSALSLSTVAAGTGGFVLVGEATGDYSGYSVASAGDINGDGYADFIIGAYGGNSAAGKNYVVFGKADWSGVSALSLSTIAAGTGGFVLTGESPSDNSGYSVASAGDINGDGYADLLVGAIQQDLALAGKSYVMFGKADWSGVSAFSLSTIAAGTGGFVLNGETNGDRSGFSVASAGDFNGDGYADFIIGANWANDIAGKSYVVFGKADWSGVSALNLSTIAAGTGGFMLAGEAIGDKSGSSVAAAGDINGDGYADLLIGAGSANDSAGKTYVLLGGPVYFNTASVLVQGTGTVMGTSASEAIVGSKGNDILTGGGGVDRFFCGAGNDVIVLTSNDIANLTTTTGTNGLLATVDGGTGIDILRLTGSANLNLSFVANIAAGTPIINSRITSIERIDLATDSTSNTLTLSVIDILDMVAMNSFNTSNGWNNLIGAALSASVQKHQLVIDGLGTGASADVVRIKNLDTAWMQFQTISGTNDTVSHSEGGVTRSYYVYNSVNGNAQLLIDTSITPILG